MAFDATVSGANATSYITVATADTILGDTPGRSAWAALSQAQKEQALMAATARIEQEQRLFRGAVATTTQRLHWPRNYVTDSDGRLFASDAQPLPLQYATAELAYAISQDSAFLDDTGLEGFRETQAGNVHIVPRHVRVAGALPANVFRHLRLLLTGSGGARAVRS
ncbi:MAG TPA: DnaT-like ssDNA-binding protein [Blastocatellia bacterium]|nr:DnaT-like ssDNA-binding protein [Blastocatellia bacterium]